MNNWIVHHNTRRAKKSKKALLTIKVSVDDLCIGRQQPLIPLHLLSQFVPHYASKLGQKTNLISICLCLCVCVSHYLQAPL